VNTLGWQKSIDNMVGEHMRFLTVVPPGATTELVLGHTSWFNDEYPAPGKSGITFIAPDIDAIYETLKERGVKFKEAVAEMPWGARATWFYDLDGNEFYLING
jgi:uncharacterized glyoxalase superfamily protein PhnB